MVLKDTSSTMLGLFKKSKRPQKTKVTEERQLEPFFSPSSITKGDDTYFDHLISAKLFTEPYVLLETFHAILSDLHESQMNRRCDKLLELYDAIRNFFIKADGKDEELSVCHPVPGSLTVMLDETIRLISLYSKQIESYKAEDNQTQVYDTGHILVKLLSILEKHWDVCQLIIGFSSRLRNSEFSEDVRDHIHLLYRKLTRMISNRPDQDSEATTYARRGYCISFLNRIVDTEKMRHIIESRVLNDLKYEVLFGMCADISVWIRTDKLYGHPDTKRVKSGRTELETMFISSSKESRHVFDWHLKVGFASRLVDGIFNLYESSAIDIIQLMEYLTRIDENASGKTNEIEIKQALLKGIIVRSSPKLVIDLLTKLYYLPDLGESDLKCAIPRAFDHYPDAFCDALSSANKDILGRELPNVLNYLSRINVRFKPISSDNTEKPKSLVAVVCPGKTFFLNRDNVKKFIASLNNALSRGVISNVTIIMGDGNLYDITNSNIVATPCNPESEEQDRFERYLSRIVEHLNKGRKSPVCSKLGWNEVIRRHHNYDRYRTLVYQKFKHAQKCQDAVFPVAKKFVDGKYKKASFDYSSQAKSSGIRVDSFERFVANFVEKKLNPDGGIPPHIDYKHDLVNSIIYKLEEIIGMLVKADIGYQYYLDFDETDDVIDYAIGRLAHNRFPNSLDRKQVSIKQELVESSFGKGNRSTSNTPQFGQHNTRATLTSSAPSISVFDSDVSNDAGNALHHSTSELTRESSACSSSSSSAMQGARFGGN